MAGAAIGRVAESIRYPIKSMAGESLDSTVLGWHGLAGDRRFAFKRRETRGGFPWLSASRHPELLRYQPWGQDETSGETLPTHVRGPGDVDLELGSDELNTQLSTQAGEPLELMQLKHGIFDEGMVSVIAASTISAIGRASGLAVDRRRFRPNVIVDAGTNTPFIEDGWVGGRLVFGDGPAAPCLSVTLRDLRCMMINLDPDTGEHDARVMRATTQLNDNHAGVYATTVRTGVIRRGDQIRLDT